MGIPGLVTLFDKIYDVSCDYRSVTGDKKVSKVALNVK
jgi:hypothetical protein